MKPGKFLLCIFALVLVGLVCFAYWNHFHNPFHFDDAHTIQNNYYIRDIKNIPLFFKDGTTSSSLPANQAYRPGVTTLNAIDVWIGGKGEPIPFYFHLSIFIAFLLVGFFIYLLSIKIYNISLPNPLNPYIALLTSAVFLLHTANAETINYIISRSDTDSTLMIVISLCLFAYLKSWKKYTLYLIPMALGFMIKEPAVMLGPLIFMYLFFFEEQFSLVKVLQSTPSLILGAAVFLGSLKLYSIVSPDNPHTILALVIGVIAVLLTTKRDLLIILIKVSPAFILAIALFVFAKHMTPSTWSSGGINAKDYMLTETFVMVHYVNNYFLPFNLSADTDWGLITSYFDDRVLIGVSFILFTLGLAYKASLETSSRPIAFGIIWFYVALVPTSTVVPFSEVLNDHRVFFPYIGLTIAFAWSLFLLYNKYEATMPVLFKPVILVLIVGFLMAHVYGVRERCKVWSSEETLWKDVTIKSPKNGRGLMNYGIVLMGKGDYTGALDCFTRAKTEWPYYSYIYVNLGVLNNALGKTADAEENYKYALQLNPQNPSCYFYYALLLKNNGRISEARAEIQQGLALSPKHLDLTRLNDELNTNPIYSGAIKSKLELLESEARQQPSAENYIALSLEYYYNARYLDCVKASEEALKLRPGYEVAYNNICSAYNMTHDWDKAIDAGHKAVAAAADPKTRQLAENNLQAALDGKKNGK